MVERTRSEYVLLPISADDTLITATALLLTRCCSMLLLIYADAGTMRTAAQSCTLVPAIVHAPVRVRVEGLRGHLGQWKGRLGHIILAILSRVLGAKTMSSVGKSTAHMLWEGGREGLTGHLRDAIIIMDVNVHDILKSTCLLQHNIFGSYESTGRRQPTRGEFTAAAADNNTRITQSNCST